jgi:hypothetical protein
MKILNKNLRYFLCALGLSLFSNLNAQNTQYVSPASPFFNKIIKEEVNFNKPQEPIKISALTFNRVFICAPANHHAWIVAEKNEIIVDIEGNGLTDIPFTAFDCGISSCLGYVYVAFQTSNGVFQCVPISYQRDTPYGISIGNFFGGNAKQILFAAARSNEVYVLRHIGGWNFTQITIGQGNGFPNHVAVRKSSVFTNDVLYTDEYGNLYRYNYSQTWMPVVLNNYCREGLAVADLNNDGKEDIVCSNTNYAFGNGGLYYQLNLSSDYDWSQMYVVSNVSGRWHGLTIGDLNNDNKVDIVACNASDSKVYIFRGNGGNPPTFSLLASIYTGTSLNSCEVKVFDLDKDGDKDIVWARGGVGSGPSLGWIRNNYPNNSFTNYIIESGNYMTYGLAVGYVNNDDCPDIVAGLNNGLYVYYGTCSITPVDIPEKFEINAKIEVKGKEVKLILNRNINDKLDIFDVSGKKLWTYYINGQQLIFRIPNSGVYVMKLRYKSYKVVIH